MGDKVGDSPGVVIAAPHRIDDVKFCPLDALAFHCQEKEFKQGVLSDLIVFVFELVFDF
jgi:hypothetical protein